MAPAKRTMKAHRPPIHFLFSRCGRPAAPIIRPSDGPTTPAVYALRYIALVLLLIAIFGPGMAVLLDPVVAAMLALFLLALLAELPDADDEDRS